MDTDNIGSETETPHTPGDENYYNSRETQKDKFIATINANNTEGIARLVFTWTKMCSYIDILEQSKETHGTKTAQAYAIMKKYDVAEILGSKRLIRLGSYDPYVYYVHVDEIFDTIADAHRRTCHGGEKRTYCELKKNVANVTLQQVRTFISLCTTCEYKKSKRKSAKPRVVRPIVSTRFGERGQMDLIDMRSHASGEYNYIFHYQDHFTKFSLLVPLKTKTAEEVSKILYIMFSAYGAPKLLQSDNGKEFVGIQVRTMIKQYWPSTTLINGRPRYPQSQGSIERANGDVENMLRSAMIDKKTSDWVSVLPYVQFCKNAANHRVIGMCPYKAVFGQDPRVMMRHGGEVRR